ncbi:MAG: phosphoketolase family protein [Planctomycetota bacterium]|nr:MAG: phosphoketolase family protein [Planctomycetota bacterium]
MSDSSEIRRLHDYWRACCFLSAGMIYLRDNPLLREPLQSEHIKERLLGHWGASPCLSFAYVHANRMLQRHDLRCLFIAGPGHGAPGVIAPVYLEGTLTERYPQFSQDIDGLRTLFRSFSFPGGLGSHCTPEIPGSIQEGGELGYALAHGFGAVFDHPELVAVTVVGDGEAETGPLATAWQSNKFLNPARDGIVLPILSLNGYKINNPTVLARVEPDELHALFRGYGYAPLEVAGSEPLEVHQRMAEAMDRAAETIAEIRSAATASSAFRRPAYPMIILRVPKGWTAPKRDGAHFIENYWRSHQVPLAGVRDDRRRLELLEQWLRSYEPETLFDQTGRLRGDLRALAPRGERRMSDTPFANGGILRRPLRLPDVESVAVAVDAPTTTRVENTRPLGEYLARVMDRNPDNFRLFGPDETKSNRLHATFRHGKAWAAAVLPEDEDEGFLSPNGRVMEILSEHTVEGWLEGYLLTGRHGLLSTYEGFAPILASMVNQFGKWLDISSDVPWRLPIASLNILLSSVVWRQDHNGFTHQDPGFINAIVDKWPNVVRVYLPPDANCLLWTVKHALQSTDRVNIIVADKQRHPQYLTAEQAFRHVAKGLGTWDFAGAHTQREPDVVLACCGDIPTKETVGAAGLLRKLFPDLAIRVVNVCNLFALTPQSEHPDGLTDREFDTYFTTDRPVIFNFHGYPWLIHRLTYRRTNHRNLHLRGYRENRKVGIDAAYLTPFLKGRGGITTPMQLAVINQIDRFSLAMDAIDRTPALAGRAAREKDWLRDLQLECLRYAYEHGTDVPGLDDDPYAHPDVELR